MAASFLTVSNYKIFGSDVISLGNITVPNNSSTNPVIKPIIVNGTNYYQFYNKSNKIIFVTDQSGFGVITGL